MFYIHLNMKTLTGYERFATFSLGSDRETAEALYKKLKGTKQVDQSGVLYLDFVEEKDGLPLNLQMLGCTLDQLADNTRIITKELFTAINLKEP